MSVELNYRIESDEHGREVLRALAGRFPTRRRRPVSESRVYYDTFDWRLHRKGWTLTSTAAEGGLLLVLGRADQGTLRQPAAGEPGFVRDLPAGALRDALRPVVEMRRLLPLVRVEEEASPVAVLDGERKTVVRIRLARDRASSNEGGSPSAVLALRIAAVKGYEADLRSVDGFLRQTGLEPSGNHFTEALAAIGRTPGDYSSKLEIALEPNLPAVEALRRIHRFLLGVLLANEDGFRGSVDSEFLHDFRVAVRRTRAALTQVKGVYPEAETERFKAGFSWLGKLTGPLRDLDVYLLQLPNDRATLPPSERLALDPLEVFLLRLHAREHRELVAGLDSSTYRELLSGWERFLERSDLADTAAEAARPIGEVAAERIARAHERVLERGRDVGPETPDGKVHRLRIDCKKLRYLLEFFRSLYQPAEVGRVVKDLRGLQDVLGEFHDCVVQQESFHAWAEAMNSEGSAPAATLLAMGRLTAHLAARKQSARERLGRKIERFTREGSADRVRGLLSPAGAPSA